MSVSASPLRDEKATQVEIDRLVNVVKPIGARALLLRTPEGNILWDCIALLDDATEALIRA